MESLFTDIVDTITWMIAEHPLTVAVVFFSFIIQNIYLLKQTSKKLENEYFIKTEIQKQVASTEEIKKPKKNSKKGKDNKNASSKKDKEEKSEIENKPEPLVNLLEQVKEIETKTGKESIEQATRTVLCMDAIKWLQEQKEIDGNIVTSLPGSLSLIITKEDVSEVNLSLEKWKEWFISTCELIFSKLREDCCAIFYQSDIKILEKSETGRNNCTEWIDKAFFVQLAARKYNVPLLWHKVFLIGAIDSLKYSRSNYSHMVCFSKKPYDIEKINTVDVAPRGKTVYTKGMGVNATVLAIKFVKDFGGKTIVDPFCGRGTTLAIANQLGLNSIGIDIKESCCRHARKLDNHFVIVSEVLQSMKESLTKNKNQNSNDKASKEVEEEEQTNE